MSAEAMSATLEDGTTFHVRPIEKPVAKEMIVRHHYSHSWNTLFGTHNFGVFVGSELLGAIVFGYPMNPASVANLAALPPESFTELNRMWVSDDLGPNTETAAMSRCFKWLRTNASIQLVQTFADGRLGCGTVYKAANFTYYGANETLFFRSSVTDETLHGVPFSNTADPKTLVRRNARLAAGELSAFRVKTHHYMLPLTRYARRRVLVDPEPYPLYDKGETPLPDYVPPASQMARALLIAEARGWHEFARPIRNYIEGQYDQGVARDAMAKAAANEWVAPLMAEAQDQHDLFGGAA